MKAICERYELPYNAGPLHSQLGSVCRKIVRLALPRSGSPTPAPPRLSAAAGRRAERGVMIEA